MPGFLGDAATTGLSRAGRMLELLRTALMAPIAAVRPSYLPLLSIYLASGALGIVAVADSFWVKKSLSLSPAELASLAVWLQLPWSAKMVVSECVDGLPILGSQRRAYTFIGAALIAAGLLLLAGAAGGWLTFAPPAQIYVLAQFAVVVGSVIQEVVADAISPAVVARVDADGRPRAKADVDRDLAMVEVLARLTYSIGALAVGWLAGVLAKHLSYQSVFLIGLVVPVLSVTGGLLVRMAPAARRSVDLRVLGGGLVLTVGATLLGLSAFRFAQELVFLLSLLVICLLLKRVLRDLDPALQRRLVLTAILVFAFRSAPMLGDGYRWFAMDRLGFDEAFFGVLQLTGTAIGLVLMWLLAGAVVDRPTPVVILGLTLVAAALFLPSLLLAHGVHTWSERALGLGPRSIALVDEAAQSPLALLATVPLLALVAQHAPPERRATWFALIASLMSLAIVASQLLTKYLNLVFPIARGDYAALPALVAGVIALALALPLAALAVVAPLLRGGSGLTSPPEAREAKPTT